MKKIFVVEHDGIYDVEHFPIPTGDIATFHGVTGVTDITDTGFSEMLDKVRNAAKETGQKEAWELITKIINMSSKDREDIFGNIWLNNIAKLGYKEAAKQYTDWTKKKAEEAKIKVGDIVTFTNDEDEVITGFVTKTEGNTIDILCKGGYTTYKDRRNLTKTGKSVFRSDKVFDISNWLKEE